MQKTAMSHPAPVPNSPGLPYPYFTFSRAFSMVRIRSPAWEHGNWRLNLKDVLETGAMWDTGLCGTSQVFFNVHIV